MIQYLVLIAVLSGQQASGTLACQKIQDDAERLACYDSAFGRLPADTATPVEPQSQPAAPVAALPAVKPASQDFGLTEEQRNQRKKDPEPTIDMIESRVVAIERHPRDRFTLTLENGQIWTQIEPTPIQRFHVGESITIRKAAFDSYLASGPSSQVGYRVRRVN